MKLEDLMGHHPFGYQSEKFSLARRAIMIPFPRGEAQGIADAFLACHLGLMDLKRELLDDNAREWVETVERAMDTSGIEDPQHLGTFFVKASRMSVDEQREFANAIDELAHYFHREFWSQE
jgi:hypothetical protein